MTDNRTTELREKLTERGIEYETNDSMGAFETSWNGFTAMQLTPGAKLMMVLTPEQAIAATLGSEREVELQSALYEVSDKWAQAQIEAEDYARENLLLKAKLDSATLGNGTLTAESVMSIAGKHQPDYCSDTHVCFDWQAIADELNAALGGGECRITASSTDGLTSDEPRHWFRLSCGHSFTVDGLDAPVACPVCGKAVKR